MILWIINYEFLKFIVCYYKSFRLIIKDHSHDGQLVFTFPNIMRPLILNRVDFG